MKKTLAALALSLGLATTPVAAQAPAAIGVSYQPSLYWALPFHYATVKGWWAQVGLNPNFSTFPAGAPQVAAAAARSWDVGGTGSVPAVLGAVRFNLMTIGITNDESKTNAVMVRGDRFDAIRANPASLRGQRLLLTTNSTVHFAARRCLERLGVNPADMQFVNLGQAQIITALTSNNGDIAASGRRTPTRSRSVPMPAICARGRGQRHRSRSADRSLGFRQGAPGRRRQVPRGLSARLVWAKANPSEARRLALDFYKQGGLEVSERAMDQEFALRPTFGLDEQLRMMARNGDAASVVDGWFGEIGKFAAEVGTIPTNPAPTATSPMNS